MLQFMSSAINIQFLLIAHLFLSILIIVLQFIITDLLESEVIYQHPFFSFLNVRHNPPTLIKQTFNTLNQLQQNALTDLYTSTNGNQWHQTWNLTKLKTDTACTELCGIICSSNDYETVVVSLALVANNLSGTIPASLKYLTSLLHIDLA
eukprot:524633_1